MIDYEESYRIDNEIISFRTDGFDCNIIIDSLWNSKSHKVTINTMGQRYRFKLHRYETEDRDIVQNIIEVRRYYSHSKNVKLPFVDLRFKYYTYKGKLYSGKNTKPEILFSTYNFTKAKDYYCHKICGEINNIEIMHPSTENAALYFRTVATRSYFFLAGEHHNPIMLGDIPFMTANNIPDEIYIYDYKFPKFALKSFVKSNHSEINACKKYTCELNKMDLVDIGEYELNDYIAKYWLNFTIMSEVQGGGIYCGEC